MNTSNTHYAVISGQVGEFKVSEKLSHIYASGNWYKIVSDFRDGDYIEVEGKAINIILVPKENKIVLTP